MRTILDLPPGPHGGHYILGKCDRDSWSAFIHMIAERDVGGPWPP
jgi:hypothetical protein